MKTPELVIPDIYAMLENQQAHEDVDIEAVLEQFGEECKDFMRTAVTEQEPRTGLRLSAVGKPARKLWQAYHGIRGNPLDGQTYVKFLMGHMTEAMVLALTKLSGHEVTEQQKVCEVEGVKGHQDARIDGLLVDVKSSSSFGMRSFKYNQLHKKDTWGYIAQLKAYAHQEGDTRYGWLAMDKSTGELQFLIYDEEDTDAPYYDAVNYDIAEKVRELKTMLDGPLPSRCYEPVADGKSGNKKLQSACSFCDFRDVCYPGLRVFQYSSGPRYLTHVVKDPRVSETPPEGF